MLLKMKVYLIILLIYFNCIVSQLSNNESLLVFFENNNNGYDLFTAKFGKTINRINESDSDLLVQTHDVVLDIDYSLSANVIIWIGYYKLIGYNFIVFYAIPINKR
jgi:hypothetical protein